ncbi:MAG: hypothetical protein IMY86_13780 [Chloroflexi bacterium]|nr:hypothetical protein [Chloroflexota bacterium]
MYKTDAQERASRKWTSWSAHFAWGTVLSLAGAAIMPGAIAWLISMLAGVMWETGYWLLTDKANHENRASRVDAIVWIMGSGAGALWAIYLGG